MMNEENKVLTEEELLELLKGIDDDIQVPLDAASAWRTAVRREAGKQKLITVSKRVSAAAAAVFVLLGVTLVLRSHGIFSTNNQIENNVSDSSVRLYYTAEANEMPIMTLKGLTVVDSDSSISTEDRAEISGAAEEAAEEENVIYTYAAASMSVNNAKAASKEITALACDMGGYIAGEKMFSYEGRKSVQLTACIPTEQLSEFGTQLTGMYPGSSFEINRQDATRLYTDASARIDSLRLMADRINSLIETADGNEISALYDQLNSVYDEIDELCVSVDSYGRDKNFSDVTITINEEENNGFGEKLQNALSNLKDSFFSDAAVTACILMPVVAIIAIIIMSRKKKK